MDSNFEGIAEDDMGIEEESIGESQNTPSVYDNQYKDSQSNSKETSRKNINNKKSNKKKPRRSRMILNEDFDSVQEHKREIYDVDTKYIKSLENGVIFNNFITSSRFSLSKHFLKRKIKYNFEREDKFPSFFNVSFLPKAEMFPVPLTTYQRSNLNMNMQMAKQQIQHKAYNASLNTAIPVINAQNPNMVNNHSNQNAFGNCTNANVIINASASSVSPSIGNNNSNSNNKGLFNVNANKMLNNQSMPPSTKNQNNNEQKIIIPLNPQTVLSNSNANQDNNKIIIPNTQGANTNSALNNAKRPLSTNSQGRLHSKEEENRILMSIIERYKTNPEGLRNEYGNEKFLKIERVLVKRGIIKPSINPSFQQSNPNHQSNTILINIPQSSNNSINNHQTQNQQQQQ